MNEHRTHLVVVLEGVDQAQMDRVLAEAGWKYGIQPFSAPDSAVALVDNIGDHTRKRELQGELETVTAR